MNSTRPVSPALPPISQESSLRWTKKAFDARVRAMFEKATFTTSGIAWSKSVEEWFSELSGMPDEALKAFATSEIRKIDDYSVNVTKEMAEVRGMLLGCAQIGLKITANETPNPDRTKFRKIDFFSKEIVWERPGPKDKLGSWTKTSEGSDSFENLATEVTDSDAIDEAFSPPPRKSELRDSTAGERNLTPGKGLTRSKALKNLDIKSSGKEETNAGRQISTAKKFIGVSKKHEPKQPAVSNEAAAYTPRTNTPRTNMPRTTLPVSPFNTKKAMAFGTTYVLPPTSVKLAFKKPLSGNPSSEKSSADTRRTVSKGRLEKHLFSETTPRKDAPQPYLKSIPEENEVSVRPSHLESSL